MATEGQAKITVHWLNSSRSERIIWLLEALGAPYEVKIYHRNRQTVLAPPELAKVHPLGKAPVVTVTPPGEGARDIVLGETGFMTEYLCDHFMGDTKLVPDRWQPGMEGKVGGETEAWMRYEYTLHYVEGSLMPPLVMAIAFNRIRGNDVPFFIRPITNIVAGRVFSAFIFPTMRKHLGMLDQQLATSPDGGPYLCGKALTAADIVLSYPLVQFLDVKFKVDELGAWEGGSWKVEFPRLFEYAKLLQREDGYQRSLKKMNELDDGSGGVVAM